VTKKTAIVTGSRRGIGLAVLTALAKDGYSAVMSGVSEQASPALEEMRSAGLDVRYIRCDVSVRQDREALIRSVTEELGRLDVLVNNAGVAPKARLDVLETTEESFDFVLNANLKGAFFLCQTAANAMLALQKQNLEDYTPRIINISSISAYTSSVNRGEYCVSKAGVSMVTALFADRLAGYGIPVFEVRPGIILTDMTSGVKEKYEKLIEGGLLPIRRLGRPEDVADCVAAAVSGRLDYATGQIINADGGFHIRRL
jgi:NAD(P)-dependent dehydrogenase (short-subunit alcohol dehydrogenase family)